ncbi:twin-arginine translocation signal domain-containing protein, partial [uncultured Akkermansia sp.]|uniref:twin-arginine translocation signal domain-containing protein n=1 Tax=uncultured Akkermansia sp. TaxID=512294 RepID=UPI0025E393FC
MGSSIWNRRDFLKTAAGAAGFLAAMPCLNAAEAPADAKPLKVGLVGCGGRGLGAMKNALDADPGTVVWALADVFQERLD